MERTITSATFSAKALEYIQTRENTSERLRGFLDGYLLAKGEMGAGEGAGAEATVPAKAVVAPVPVAAPMAADPPKASDYVTFVRRDAAGASPPVRPVRGPDREPFRRNHNRGIQARILRLMFTGPLTRSDLVRELGMGWGRAVRETITRLRAASLVTHDATRPETLLLTEAGRAKAKFFVDNPELLVSSNAAANRK